MSFHLIAVGGSGLWAMYHHLLKYAAQASSGMKVEDRVPLPTQVTVIDQAGDDVAAILEELHTLNQALGRRGFQIPTPNRIRLSSARQSSGAPATHIASAADVGSVPVQGNAESMLAHACLSHEGELRRDTNIGFFGQPRLTSWWANLFGFDVETAAQKDESKWLDAVRSKDLPDRRNHRAMDSLPIVLVGSIVGGTGAGLMPTLTSELIGELATTDATSWRHDFHAIALLPWFDMGAEFQGPKGARLKANAARGAQALLGVFDRVQSRLAGNPALGIPAVAPSSNKRTSLSLIGARLDLITAQRPLDPRADAPTAREALSVGPIFDVVSAAIEHALTPPPQSVTNREHPRVNVFALGTVTGEGGRIRIWTPDAEGHVVAAHRALMICNEQHFPLNAASHFLPFLGKAIQRPAGLGKAMSTILAGAAQAGTSRLESFITAYREELQRLAQATFEEYGKLPGSAEGALSAALEVDSVIKALDTILVEAELKDHLFTLADTGRNANLDEQDIRSKAVAAAHETWSILAGAAARSDLSPTYLSKPADSSRLIIWTPGTIASNAKSTDIAGDAPGKVYDFRIADPNQSKSITDTVRSCRNALAGGLAYDTEGWAELFGHYQSILADVEVGRNLQALDDATWLRFRAATKRLYIGVALGTIDILPLTDAEKVVARIGTGQQTLDDRFPLKLVLRAQPQYIVGFVLPNFGLCPSPRAVTLEQPDPLTAQLEAIPNAGPQVAEAESAIRWFSAGLPAEEPARMVLDLLFAGGPAEMPQHGPGMPKFIPGAAFGLRDSKHFLPRLRTPPEVASMAKLDRVPSGNPMVAGAFAVPFGNDGYLLPGLPAAVQAHCNGLPAAAPNSIRPLVNKFHNVS